MQTRSKRNSVCITPDSAIQPVYPGTKRTLYQGEHDIIDIPATTSTTSDPTPCQETKKAEEEACPQPSFEVLIGGEPLDLNQKSYDPPQHHQEVAQGTRYDSRRIEGNQELSPAKLVQASKLIGPRIQASTGSSGSDDSAASGSLGERLSRLEYQVSSLRIDNDIIYDKLKQIEAMAALFAPGGKSERMLSKLWSLLKYCEDNGKLPYREWYSDPNARRDYFNDLWARKRSEAANQPRPNFF